MQADNGALGENEVSLDCWSCGVVSQFGNSSPAFGASQEGEGKETAFWVCPVPDCGEHNPIELRVLVDLIERMEARDEHTREAFQL